jgi:hypothetical protein
MAIWLLSFPWAERNDLHGSFFHASDILSWTRPTEEVEKGQDWVGALVASACMTMLLYVFAMITSSTSTIRHVPNIVLLSLAAMLMPAFIFWVGRQERLSRPAIIPNSIWHNLEFTCICITVFLTWAMFNAFGYFTTLLLQDVQHISATQTSLRFLPMVIVGFGTSILPG